MGFAEADPRQLAPTVGRTRVGITISATRHRQPRTPKLLRFKRGSIHSKASRSSHASPARDQMHVIDEQDGLKPTGSIEATLETKKNADPEEKHKLQSRNHKIRHSICQRSKSK